MQGKWSKVKNFASEERKQSKKHCSPVKLQSKKQDKKIIAPGRVQAERSHRSSRKSRVPLIMCVSVIIYYVCYYYVIMHRSLDERHGK